MLISISIMRMAVWYASDWGLETNREWERCSRRVNRGRPTSLSSVNIHSSATHSIYWGQTDTFHQMDHLMTAPRHHCSDDNSARFSIATMWNHEKTKVAQSTLTVWPLSYVPPICTLSMLRKILFWDFHYRNPSPKIYWLNIVFLLSKS